MRFNMIPALSLPLVLALGACANSEDASTEAEADTVEIPAFDALSNVDELPVADPEANTDLGVDEGEVEESEEGAEATDAEAGDAADEAAEAVPAPADDEETE